MRTRTHVHALRACIRRSADGSKPTAPVWRFGTTTREKARKVFAEHARPADFEADGARPGPGRYSLPSSIGVKQPDSGKADPPQWTLAARVRPSVEPPPGEESPGAIYSPGKGVGSRQPESTRRNEPSWGMAARTKMRMEVSDRVTRAIATDRPPVRSVHRAMARSLRSGCTMRSRTSIVDCAVRATQVGEGVGPIYDLPRAIAKQVDGHRQSAPCPSFTRHSRWAAHEAELRRNTVPGPGYYG